MVKATPRERWRAESDVETAGWVTTSRSAAPRMEPVSTTARKARSCPSVIKE
jgi:hypothetical protein